MLFVFILSGLMSLMVSGISTWRAAGPGAGFMQLWAGAWGASWVVAFPIALFVAPLARRLAARLVSSS